ncbi:twin-arginine translocase TatA/TatE family subunit [Salinadaptatus halalkaliphilus]|uniref:Twin-arginine translocase TatA/TatE family subunit n=1 Tax=Salinadaptatus halalkaliphilus TaxID=2419781 RepID=A0A4S3TJ50_9EURY|nr:twin-arginine translocase TatA/TatE family subunit [Salinadaptatus halalkaliphilus]THE62905.1 twin-arginine translocase TatA/TatE family subunit [Salinadaptatus halalkaliphilus]
MVAEIAPLFIPGVPGGPELLIILFIAILLFGANKIPKLARSTGEAMGEFQKGREKVETELEEMRDGDFEELDEEEDADTDFVDTEPVTNDDADADTDAETETETN